MAMEDAVMEEPEDPASFADLSVIFAVCAGKAGRCGIAYVDLEDAERVLCVADVMDPDFTQLERGTTADWDKLEPVIQTQPARIGQVFSWFDCTSFVAFYCAAKSK